MTKIIYIEKNGNQSEVDIEPGASVMHGATSNNLQGIIAECGGFCSCATCHVYVHPDWVNKLGPKSPTEEALLEEVCDMQPNSRLSCQINVSDDLEGMVVYLPEKQV